MLNLFSDMVQGTPIVVLVLGLCQYAKVTFNTDARVTNLISMLIGLLLGAGYMLSRGVPAAGDYPAWFSIAVYGLGLGLVASGIFKVGAQLAAAAAPVITVAPPVFGPPPRVTVATAVEAKPPATDTHLTALLLPLLLLPAAAVQDPLWLLIVLGVVLLVAWLVWKYAIPQLPAGPVRTVVVIILVVLLCLLLLNLVGIGPGLNLH